MIIIELVSGFFLLLAGRNLFWLCVGIVGFLIGVQCATLLGYPTNGWTAWVSAIALGSVGVVLAMSFEWVTVVLGVGFLGGGYLLMNIFSYPAGQDLYAWPVFVVGGIIGMCLMVIIFDWTLIIISSLLGAVLIVNTIHLSGWVKDLLFTGIMLTGILVQYVSLNNVVARERTTRRT